MFHDSITWRSTDHARRRGRGHDNFNLSSRESTGSLPKPKVIDNPDDDGGVVHCQLIANRNFMAAKDTM